MGSGETVSSQKIPDKISSEGTRSSFQVQSCSGFHMSLLVEAVCG